MLECLEAIAAGEIYQACVCTQFTGRLDGAPVDFFADAVERTSPARAAYLAGDWGAVASLSPELFLRRCGEAVTSSPIKGTLPRHADPAELRASVKDVAENIMIVDLVRNDLGRVAVTGIGDRARTAGGATRAGGVASGVDGIGARRRRRADGGRARCDVPAGVGDRHTEDAGPSSCCRGWEPHRRGVYCGTVGLASPVAGCELNVAIRTVEFDAVRQRGPWRRRRHHRRLRSRPRVGRVPAQGGTDH